MNKILIDNAIPFIKGVFEPYAEVRYKAGAEIGPEDVSDVDALIIRTRTHCDEALLGKSSVKVIATATIGTDHIDLPWCDHKGILVSNAAGCNAGGVMQYVFSALYGVAARKGIKLEGKTIGIIGVGHVGRRVENMARHIGFKVLKCDPPRAVREGSFGFCDQDYLLRNSDIVTLHVPLSESTRNMADKAFFKAMKPGTIFINASRGEVVDEKALIAASKALGAIIIDTWKGEPNINRELMNLCDIATPHIAGYSYQGKQNGTSKAVRAVARFFKMKELYDFFPKTEMKENEAVKLNLKGMKQGEIAAVLQYNYPIFTDDFLFRLRPEDFETLRSKYNYRREVFID